MKVQNQQNPSAQSFSGYASVLREVKHGKKASEFIPEFKLKKKEFPAWDTLSFLTAITSMAGFAIGGTGLLSDYLSKNKEKPLSKNTSQVPDSFKNVGSAKDTESDPNDKNKKDKKEGAKTIVPSTKFSKMGLTFAKIGIAFSGIAGIFNGISMGLPLMAAGEALNLCSSPIIETPVGTGLFGIALAAVFSGRALENDPELKLDNAKLKEKVGLKNKAQYILDNMKGCLKEVWHSGGVITTNIGDLFKSSKRKEAMNFFRDNVFSIKPKKLVLQEFIKENGTVEVVRGFKNNPYLMHGASLLLVAGGATLVLSSLIKNTIGQKVGLKTYEVGGSLDNLSLSRWGMEKASTAGSPTTRLAGYLMGASGLAILAGQPGVDEKWGRGIQWLGTALLFSVFAVERFPKAFKTVASKPEFKSLIRQWEIDMTKLYSNSELKPKLGSLVKAIANGKEVEDANVREIIDVAEKIFKKENINGKNSVYRESAEKILAEIKATLESKPELKGKFDEVFKHFGHDGNSTELIKSIERQSKAAFEAA